LRSNMNECYLLKPDISFENELISYRNEFINNHDSMDGTSRLEKIENIADWILFNQKLEHQETLPDGPFVPSSLYLYVRKTDHKIVGMINIRHCFNDYLENFGGHIGYSVLPSERRKGYAKNMLKDALPYCKTLGIKNVLITCIQGNEGSKRTILSNGGKYENTIFEPDENIYLERYWINL